MITELYSKIKNKNDFYIKFDFNDKNIINYLDIFLKDICNKDTSLLDYFNNKYNRFKSNKKNYIYIFKDTSYHYWAFLNKNTDINDRETIDTLDINFNLNTVIKTILYGDIK